MKKDPKKHDVPVKALLNIYWLRAKLEWAGWMERQCLKLSRRAVIATFIAFVAISASCCLLLMLYGVTGLFTGGEAWTVPISTIRTANTNSPYIMLPDTMITKRVEAFHNYMDSLESSPSGIRLRDSILQARPGLMDSLRMAESYITKNK